MQTAKLFKNGQSQAVRLPMEFRFPGQDVFIKKIGRCVILMPTNNPWQPLKESLGRFSSDFMSDRNQPSLQDREGLFS